MPSETRGYADTIAHANASPRRYGEKTGADGRIRTGDLLITKGTPTLRSDASLRLVACEGLHGAARDGTYHGTTHPSQVPDARARRREPTAGFEPATC